MFARSARHSHLIFRAVARPQTRRALPGRAAAYPRTHTHAHTMKTHVVFGACFLLLSVRSPPPRAAFAPSRTVAETETDPRARNLLDSRSRP